MPAPQPDAAPARPAAPLPAIPSPSVTGTDASRALLRPVSEVRPLTLWGSSSMSSERGDESTPVPIRIHEHLALSATPALVHGFGVGATKSAHTLLLRGLDTPVLSLVGAPAPDTSRIAVTLDSGLVPQGPIRVPGDVDGIPGVLDGSTGSWFFTPDDASTPIPAGRFTSALTAVAEGSRQVVWMGKNNIRDVTGVLRDTQRMVDAAPEGDTLVLGHWCTASDETGSATGEAVRAVNTEQARRYGDAFLDLQGLLTGEEGLHCSPLAPLALLEQGSTQDALGRGIVPPLLVAHDGIHLNGWGNLAVSWAIVRRMRELQWL
jgi:hypothetical protein